MTEVLAAVVRAEPDWAALPSDVPPASARCCTDAWSRIAAPGSRMSRRHCSCSIVRPQLVSARSRGGARAAVTGTAMAAHRGTDRRCRGGGRPRRHAHVGWPRAPRRLLVVVTTITTSGSAALSCQGSDRDLAITPDGSRIVYRGDNQLLVRALDQLEPTVLSGLGAPRGVFISPDGQWVGFFDGRRA